MKTLITSLALALMVSGTSLAAIDKPADDQKAAMQTAVFPSATAPKLNVIVDNGSHRAVAVRLLDQHGNMLAQQFIGKAEKVTKVRFDLSLLPDGAYQVEINNGETKEIKQVTLNTTKPAVADTRSIALN